MRYDLWYSFAFFRCIFEMCQVCIIFLREWIVEWPQQLQRKRNVHTFMDINKERHVQRCKWNDPDEYIRVIPYKCDTGELPAPTHTHAGQCNFMWQMAKNAIIGLLPASHLNFAHILYACELLFSAVWLCVFRFVCSPVYLWTLHIHCTAVDLITFVLQRISFRWVFHSFSITFTWHAFSRMSRRKQNAPSHYCDCLLRLLFQILLMLCCIWYKPLPEHCCVE